MWVDRSVVEDVLLGIDGCMGIDDGMGMVDIGDIEARFFRPSSAA